MIWFSDNSITIFISSKSDGDLLFKASLVTTDNKQIDADEANKKIKANREKFFEENNINPERLVNYVAEHGNSIHVVDKHDLGKGALNPETRIRCDGLITNIKNSYLMVTGADCFPVFFYDEKNYAIGVAHAGWRGILANVVGETVKALQKEYCSEPQNIKIWIGPGIRVCHFEVQKDVSELFSKNHKNAIMEKDGKTFIDLPLILKSQLIELGVPTKNITEHPDCTFSENRRYFSYRRGEPGYVEANAFIINFK